MKRALDGIRAVETASLAAAFAGRWLADLGADVWKIEPPGGDPLRSDLPLFAFYHSGKRSAVVDPTNPSELARLERFVAAADVWVDTPNERVWTIAPSELRLVVARLGTPAGGSSDLVAQAASGMLAASGLPGEAPLQAPGLQAYHLGSASLAIEILAALVGRQRSGRGRTITVDLVDAVARAIAPVLAAEGSRGRTGRLHATRLFRLGRARDRDVLFSLAGDWTTLREWVKQKILAPELEGASWEDLDGRRAHADEAFSVLDRFGAELSSGELFEEAQRRRLPFAVVRSPAELADCGQLAARGFFDRELRPGPAFRMSRTPLFTGGDPPALGDSPLPDARDADGTRDDHHSAGRGLERVRVLDLTHAVAGPLASHLLATHGADVARVVRFAENDAAARSVTSRGKRMLALDLATRSGRETARDLVRTSDVVIDNFSPRVMENWGLGPGAVLALRPSAIALGLSAFGRTGPWRDYVAFGPTIQALAGYTWRTRYPGGPPIGLGFSFADVCAAFAGAIATLAALFHRERTGDGQAIDLSEYECAIAFLARPLGESPEPSVPNASQEAPAAPHGVYRARGHDSWVAIAVRSEAEWRRFAARADRRWLEDRRFRTLESRLRNQSALNEALERWTSERTAGEAGEFLRGLAIAAEEVRA